MGVIVLAGLMIGLILAVFITRQSGEGKKAAKGSAAKGSAAKVKRR
jgi:F0F1-type ATP synthase assembly protein I